MRIHMCSRPLTMIARGRELRVRVAAGATPRNRSFLGVLATVLRTVAIAIGIVCLAAVAQTLALTTRDRRRALAVLRARRDGR